MKNKDYEVFRCGDMVTWESDGTKIGKVVGVVWPEQNPFEVIRELRKTCQFACNVGSGQKRRYESYLVMTSNNILWWPAGKGLRAFDARTEFDRIASQNSKQLKRLIPAVTPTGSPMTLTADKDIRLLISAGWIRYRESWVDPVTGDKCVGVEAVRRQMARNGMLLQPEGCYGYGEGYREKERDCAESR